MLQRLIDHWVDGGVLAGVLLLVLSPLAVIITNVPGVWGVIAASLDAASTVDLGWALVAVHLVLVNAVVHIVHGMVYRRDNPGLGTAIVVFLPLGTATLILVDRAGGRRLARPPRGRSGHRGGHPCSHPAARAAAAGADAAEAGGSGGPRRGARLIWLGSSQNNLSHGLHPH